MSRKIRIPFYLGCARGRSRFDNHLNILRSCIARNVECPVLQSFHRVGHRDEPTKAVLDPVDLS